MIRRVSGRDRQYVLGYCKDTFGWGDYIKNVWDRWLSEGEFLAYEAPAYGPQQKGAPVGICHAHISRGQVWVEGIRVHPQYRRRGVATMLVGAAEDLVLRDDRYCAYHLQDGRPHVMSSRMLIDAANCPSLEMARMLGYDATHTWTYYRLKPQRRSDTCSIFGPADLDASICSHYVDSWRWFETDCDALRSMASAGQVVAVPAAMRGRGGSSNNPAAKSVERGSGVTVAITTISESIASDPRMALYAVIYPGADTCHVKEMVGHLGDVAARRGCTSANLFTQGDRLPACSGLTKSFEFCLVEKPLL